MVKCLILYASGNAFLSVRTGLVFLLQRHGKSCQLRRYISMISECGVERASLLPQRSAAEKQRIMTGAPDVHTVLPEVQDLVLQSY